MFIIKADFNDLLDIIDELSSEQKRIVRQRLDEQWAARFEKALDDIHADMPTNLPESEINADIEAAINESRHEKS